MDVVQSIKQAGKEKRATKAQARNNKTITVTTRVRPSSCQTHATSSLLDTRVSVVVMCSRSERHNYWGERDTGAEAVDNRALFGL